jgi:ParB family chromosome partitioning protein
MRLLSLPDHMLQALGEKRIMEGHTRPLLMLVDRPEEQETLFQDILTRKLNVRESEMIARRIAKERARKKEKELNPEIIEFENRFNEVLGTKVHIESKEQGGKITIDYYDLVDLKKILDKLQNEQSEKLDDENDTSSVLVNDNGDEIVVEAVEEEENPDIYSVMKFSV